MSNQSPFFINQEPPTESFYERYNITSEIVAGTKIVVPEEDFSTLITDPEGDELRYVAVIYALNGPPNPGQLTGPSSQIGPALFGERSVDSDGRAVFTFEFTDEYLSSISSSGADRLNIYYGAIDEINLNSTRTVSLSGEYVFGEEEFVGGQSPIVESGVEGEDYIYGGVQINDTNNNWGRRGFNEAGDYWVKVKNQTDDPLIGNGQEIALVMGSADTIFGTNIQTEDILTGLQEGTLISTKSWTSYDGTFNIASFDGAEVQSLIDSGDTLRIARVDATTGEQIGGTQLFDETLMYGDFDQNYNNSLSAANDFNYADILAANVDPII